MLHCRRRVSVSLGEAGSSFMNPALSIPRSPWKGRSASWTFPTSLSLSLSLQDWESEYTADRRWIDENLPLSFSILYPSPPLRADLEISGASLFPKWLHGCIEHRITWLISFFFCVCVSPHQNLVFYLQRNYLKSLSTCPKDVVIAQNVFSAFLLGSFLEDRTHFFSKWCWKSITWR